MQFIVVQSPLTYVHSLTTLRIFLLYSTHTHTCFYKQQQQHTHTHTLAFEATTHTQVDKYPALQRATHYTQVSQI